MSLYFHSGIEEKVKLDIKDYMKNVKYEDKEDDEVTRLYCVYNSDIRAYYNYTTNYDKLINKIELYNTPEEHFVELDLKDYYLDILKDIVTQKNHCEFNKLKYFNSVALDLMAYGNIQVLNENYSLRMYKDIFDTIIKLKGVIE